MRAFAVLFPGQGSQEAGMGAALAAEFAASRAVFDAADAALDVALSGTCFEGPAEALAKTEITQPAILTVSVAALEALRETGMPPPVAAAGHSLGEYSAHVAAGTIPFADAVRAVRLRGRFMQDAVPHGKGAMVAVLGLTVEAVEEVCREVCAGGGVAAPANLNAPGQVVVAGDSETVDRAVERLRSVGAKKVVPLAVSAPFHCALMAPAARRLRPVLEGIDFRDPQLAVYTNVRADRVRCGSEAREDLVEQVTSPVRWTEQIRRMIDDGISTFVEVGPGKVLSGLVRKIAPAARIHLAHDPETVRSAVRALEGDA